MILKTILNVIESTIPVAGDVVDQIRSPEGGKGTFKITPRFVKQIIRLVVAGAVMYMAIKGTISLEEAQDIIKQ